MRYEKGSININPQRDVPLLQQVLRSGFITTQQLFQFMQLNQCECSQPAFLHRVRRLVDHGLIEKRKGISRQGEPVYAITAEGATLLVDLGELYAGRKSGLAPQHTCAHWLDINKVHLALWRSEQLVRWIPASEICSQNDLTHFRYAKDYDAVVEVRCGGTEARFAFEYERTAKTFKQYQQICEAIDHELHVNTILYLTPNRHLLSFLRDTFRPRRKTICVALLPDFVDRLLQTRVVLAGNEHSSTIVFEQILKQHDASKGENGRP